MPKPHPPNAPLKLHEPPVDIIRVRNPDRRSARREAGAANLAEEIVDLSGVVGLRVDDGDAVGGFGHEEGARAAADGGELQGAVARYISCEHGEWFPGARIPDDGGLVLVSCCDVQHVRGPGAGEAEVAVAAEGLDGAAGIGFDDEGVGGVAYYDAEAAVWGCGGAVDGAGEVVVSDEGVGFAVEDAEVVVV